MPMQLFGKRSQPKSRPAPQTEGAEGEIQRRAASPDASAEDLIQGETRRRSYLAGAQISAPKMGSLSSSRSMKRCTRSLRFQAWMKK